jgi:hypothetical protein
VKIEDGGLRMERTINHDRRAIFSVLAAPVALTLLFLMILFNPEKNDILWPLAFPPIALGLAVAGIIAGFRTRNTKSGISGLILNCLVVLPCLWGMFVTVVLLMWWIAVG